MSRALYSDKDVDQGHASRPWLGAASGNHSRSRSGSRLLQETLEEESAADEKLASVWEEEVLPDSAELEMTSR